MKRLKIGLIVTALAGLTVISTASAGVFGSSPDGCTTGIYAGYSGTQQDGSTVPLYLAAVGNSIVGTSSTRTFGAEDFFWFNYEGGTNDIAEWAPFGVASNEVMAVVPQPLRPHYTYNAPTTSYAVVLQQASGATNQQWTYNGTGWTNVATGPDLVLQTNGNNNPVTMAPVTATPNQTFSFVEGQ
jgi:hypothetical protein